MPATAGRVRMPANNRVHSSAALQTHGIWQSAIGYDPYAPTNKDDSKKASQSAAPNASEPDGENAYASFQGLLALARVTNSNSDEARGACNKCGRVGHLTFQCRNFLSVKEDVKREGIDDEALRDVVLGKLKGEKVKMIGKGESGDSSDEDDDDEESDLSSDSEYDSEMERIIAEKTGKKASGRGRVSSRKREEDEDVDKEKSRKRGRSKQRRSKKRDDSDSEDENDGRRSGRKKRKEKRRRDDDSSDEEEEGRRRKRKSRKEKRRRRSHRHSSEDSDYSSEASADRRHRRRNRRSMSLSDSEASRSDDSRIGRGKKRAEKNARKHRSGKED